MVLEVIISRLADEHSLEDLDTKASKIILDAVTPKLQKRGAESVFFGQLTSRPKCSIIVIRWNDIKQAEKQEKTGKTGNQSSLELMREDLDHISHTSFRDPVLHDFVDTQGIDPFAETGRGCISILTLTHPNDPAWNEYKKEMEEVLKNYSLEYYARQRDPSKTKLPPPAVINFQHRTPVADLTKPQVHIMIQEWDKSALGGSFNITRKVEREEIKNGLRAGNHVVEMFRAL